MTTTDIADLEKTFIGALLAIPGNWSRVSEIITSADLFDHDCKAALHAINSIDLEGGTIDVRTVYTALAKAKANIPIHTLDSWVTMCPAPAQGLLGYVHEIKGNSKLRKLFEAGKNISAMAKAGGIPATILEAAEGLVVSIRDDKEASKVFTTKDTTAQMKANYADIVAGRRSAGIMTGFPGLDDLMLGMKPGQSIVLGAGTSMGKTALALSIIKNVGEFHKVLYFSMEMPAVDIGIRLASMLARVNSGRYFKGILSDREVSQLETAYNELETRHIRIVEGCHGMASIRSITRRMKALHGVDLLVIDHLQFIDKPAGAKDQVHAMSVITKAIKSLAVELKIPVISLSQINRDSKGEAPQLWNLRESGTIEQDADIVMLLFREAMVNPEAGNPEGAEINVAKNRNGKTGKIALRFIPDLALFEHLGTHGESLKQQKDGLNY